MFVRGQIQKRKLEGGSYWSSIFISLIPYLTLNDFVPLLDFQCSSPQASPNRKIVFCLLSMTIPAAKWLVVRARQHGLPIRLHCPTLTHPHPQDPPPPPQLL